MVLYRSRLIRLLLTRAKSDQKWSSVLISGLELANTHFLNLKVFKIVCTALWLMNYFNPTTSFPKIKHCYIP